MAFGFGKKLTAEEKMQWDQEIKELLAKEDFETAAKRTKEYEKADKAAAAYFLAMMNHAGQGVKQQNLEKAVAYIETYTNKYGDDPEGWFYGSSVMMSAGRFDDSTEWLMKAEALGKEKITRHMAEYFSFMGMSHYNTACLTLQINQRKSLSSKAQMYFTKAMQKYEQMREEDGEVLTSNDWTQMGYNVHYLHYLALNSDQDVDHWTDVAAKTIADMEKEGYVVQAAYTRAMVASNEANLNKSKEALDQAKQYLDQALTLSGDQKDKYYEEYELVWKEYDRLVKLLEKEDKRSEKKGLFGGLKRK